MTLDHCGSIEVQACTEAKGLGRRPASADTIGVILCAAREEFASRGFDGTTVESIARKAGVSKQLIYYYFGSKADLYALILEEAAVGTSTFSEDMGFDAVDARRALEMFVDGIFMDYLRRPEIVQMTIDEVQHGLAHVGKRSSLAPVLRGGIEILEQILGRGRDAGTVRADADAHTLFWTIYSLVTTWFSQAPMISLVSGRKMEGDMGLTNWRAHCSRLVVASVLKESDGARADGL